jgi:site-specific recombinase XerD
VRLDKCRCPFHIDGIYREERVRKSLKTRSQQLAERRLTEEKSKIDAKLDTTRKNSGATETQGAGKTPERTVAEAIDRFLISKGRIDPTKGYSGDVGFGTYRKYRCCLAHLKRFCERAGITALPELPVDRLEDYRGGRTIALVTWRVELQALRTFFAYCVSRKWIRSNPAKELKSPRHLKPNEIVPYTLEEESRILVACGQIGGGKYHRSGAGYERLRARAMIMLLRHTALRVSDVATMKKNAISWDADKLTWRIFVRTQKTGDPVFLPIPDSLKLILDALPLPRNASQDCPYFFWNGQTSHRAVVGIAERTLASVFKKSGVKDAHAHRYRHTLATRLLGEGASFEAVADILGNTPEVVRKHYGKWSKGRQDNIDRLMMAHFQSAVVTNAVTPESHEKAVPVN